MVITPTIQVKIRLCLTVKRNKSHSAHQAYRRTGDSDRLREIILPVTPPVVLAATSNRSETPICCAAVVCKAANRALDDIRPGQEYPQPAEDPGEKKVNA